MIGCDDCKKSTGGDCGKHGPTVVRSNPPQGWQCPVCGGVYSPYVAECSYCAAMRAQAYVTPSYSSGRHFPGTSDLLLAENKRLRAALEKYADIGSWVSQAAQGSDDLVEYVWDNVEFEPWEIARQALSADNTDA